MDANMRGDFWQNLITGDHDVALVVEEAGMFGGMAPTDNDLPITIADPDQFAFTDRPHLGRNRRHGIAKVAITAVRHLGQGSLR